MIDFPHPSRPGFHRGVVLGDAQRQALSALLDALIPGNDQYPSASSAQVPAFVEARMSATDIDHLDALLARSEAPITNGNAAGFLAGIEEQDPLRFAWLREFAYHGYYAAPRVLATMAERGYAYHGAPQPLGYLIEETMRVPAEPRGSYIPTTEVTRAAL